MKLTGNMSFFSNEHTNKTKIIYLYV